MDLMEHLTLLVEGMDTRDFVFCAEVINKLLDGKIDWGKFETEALADKYSFDFPSLLTKYCPTCDRQIWLETFCETAYLMGTNLTKVYNSKGVSDRDKLRRIASWRVDTAWKWATTIDQGKPHDVTRAAMLNSPDMAFKYGMEIEMDFNQDIYQYLLKENRELATEYIKERPDLRRGSTMDHQVDEERLKTILARVELCLETHPNPTSAGTEVE
jgi:hypothetical protein